MKWFTAEEFECKCGCGDTVSNELMALMDALREKVGAPIVINSGARCAEHNKYIGGSKTSSHLKGLAVDIRCESSALRFRIIKEAIALGFSRIGVGSSFIHLDIDTDKASGVAWVY